MMMSKLEFTSKFIKNAVKEYNGLTNIEAEWLIDNYEKLQSKLAEIEKQEPAGYFYLDSFSDDKIYQKAEIAGKESSFAPLYSLPVPDYRQQLAESMARTLLWIAYVWNDHNFQHDPKHYAQKCAVKLGIGDFDKANDWLEGNLSTPTPPSSEPNVIEMLQNNLEALEKDNEELRSFIEMLEADINELRDADQTRAEHPYDVLETIEKLREASDPSARDPLEILAELRGDEQPDSAAVEPVYFWKEIGETDWIECHKQWFDKCSESPEHDTKLLYTAPPTKPQRITEQDSDSYHTDKVFTKYEYDREAARLGVIIEGHIDDSAWLMEQFSLAVGKDEHYKYRSLGCRLDRKKIKAAMTKQSDSAAKVVHAVLATLSPKPQRITEQDAREIWVHGYEAGHNEGIGCGHSLAPRCRHRGEDEFYADDISDLLAKLNEHREPDYKARNEIYLAALKESACLGNGDKYGNSDGNVIAQRAIAKASASNAEGGQ